MTNNKILTESQVDQIVTRWERDGLEPRLSMLYVFNPFCSASYLQVGRYIITSLVNGRTEEGSVVIGKTENRWMNLSLS